MSFFKRKIDKVFNQTDIAISKSKLEGSQWIKAEENQSRIIYTFMQNRRLLISDDGVGSEAEWEFLVDNDTLMIKKSTITVFNCHIVYDEFLILNKDNTDEFELFANFTKYKNLSPSDAQNKFKSLFATIESNKNISNKDKIYVVQLYELRDLLRIGKNKGRVLRLIRNLVHDEETGRLFNIHFHKVFGYPFVHELNGSQFKNSDRADIARPLLSNRVIGID